MNRTSQILSPVRFSRTRELPIYGKIIVRKGQKINQGETIAEANLFPDHLLMSISEGLNVSPEIADQSIQVSVGNRFIAGDILAGPVGLFRRVVRAPADGKMLLAGSGQLLIEIDTPPFELTANAPGIVRAIIPGKGAVIESFGSVIQGRWGNGKIDSGILYILEDSQEHELTPDQFEIDMRSSIVFGANCSDPEVLEIAEDLPLRGLILAGMDSALMHLAEKSTVPIMVIEGFGHRKLNYPALKILKAGERLEVFLNAGKWNPYYDTRPEVVIPQDEISGIGTIREHSELKKGTRIRIIDHKYSGNIGTLSADPEENMIFQSGYKAKGAKVRLQTGDIKQIPISNMEEMVGYQSKE